MDRRAFLEMAGGLSLAPFGGTRNNLAYVPLDTLLPSATESFEPWIEVNRANLASNAAALSDYCSNRPVLAVLKNNAYGHGLTLAASVLEAVPAVHGFAVVKIAEALALRAAGITKPVLLLGPAADAELRDVVMQNVMPSLMDDRGPTLEALASQLGRAVPIHVYVDTGMGRAGVPHDQAAALIESLDGRAGVVVDGTFTDLTEVGDADRLQIQRLNDVSSAVRRSGATVGRLHAASSDGIFSIPEAHLDMLRPGLALYGGYSSAAAALRPTLSLKTRIMYVKRLEPGDWLQYGRAYVARRRVWVASMPVGHTDGVPTSAVGRTNVLVGGRAYPLIASITANHAIIEVGDEPAVAVGDEAVLIGRSGGQEVSVTTFASRTGTNIYKLLMNLGPLIRRIAV